MDMAIRAFPLLENQEGALRAFARQLAAERADETGDFYARFGVDREVWCLQQTPIGPWVIAVTLTSGGAIEQAGEAYAASAVEFDNWFKAQVMKLTGVDPAAQPLGPATELIFDSRATSQRQARHGMP